MRTFSIFTLLVASAAFSQAAIVTNFCPVTPGGANVGTYLNGTGTINYGCTAFTAPSGEKIDSITLTGYADFSFGTGSPTNTFQVTYQGLPVGFTPTSFTATATGNGISSSSLTFATSSLGSGLPLTSYGAFTVQGVGSTTAGAVASANGALQVTYNTSSTVPEPSTLALVGGVLVLAGFRKYRS